MIHEMEYTYKPLYNQLIAKANALQLNDQLESQGEQQEMEQVLKTTRSELKKLTATVDELNQIKLKLEDQSAKINPMLTEIEPMLLKLDQLCRLENLLRRLNVIKENHRKLESSIKSKDLLIILPQLIESFDAIVNVYYDIEKSNCDSLKNYLKAIVSHWHNLLLDKLYEPFEKQLQTIQWPKIGSQSAQRTTSASQEALGIFGSYFYALLKFDVEEELIVTEKVSSSSDLKSKLICLPMRLMLSPLKKRFHFHFMDNNSKINRKEKVTFSSFKPLKVSI